MNFNTSEYSYNTSNENWRKSISYLFIGLMLNLFRVPLFFLDFILPLAGFVFMFLGANQLRRVNVNFQNVYYLVVVQIVVLIIDSFTRNSGFLSMVFWWVKAGIQLAILYYIKNAVFEAYHSVGRVPSRDPFTLLMIWVVVTTILNSMFLLQLLLFIPVTITFVYLVYDFNKFRLETMELDVRT